MAEPVPREWFRKGVPPESVAAFYEGMCPVHMHLPLAEGMFRTGGKKGMPVSWIAGGWCDPCQAWWHSARSFSGLGAVYDASD